MVTYSMIFSQPPFARFSRSRPSRNPSLFLNLHTLKKRLPQPVASQGLPHSLENIGGMGGDRPASSRKFGAVGRSGFFGEREPRLRDIADALQCALHLSVLGF